jgi:phage-related minor tail protein
MSSEAVLPLKRLANGNLGVQTGGGGGGMVQVNTPITINSGRGGQGGGLDNRTMTALQKQIEVTARTAVKGVLADERRPGEDLCA